MSFSWKWLSEVVDAAVNLVDKAVPAFVGQRTKIAVVACPLLGFAAPVVAGFVPGSGPVLSIVQSVLCAAAPVTALAGLLRK